MATIDLAPTATVSSSGIDIVGAASAHAALADGSDTSYVVLGAGGGGSPADALLLDFADLSISATARIRYVQVYHRIARAAFATSSYFSDIYVGPHYARVTPGAYNDTPAWYFAAGVGFSGESIVDANVDAARAYFAGAQSAINLYEVRLRVWYVPAPTVNITAPTGTVTTTSAPLVSWTSVLDPDGDRQTHFEVTIKDDASQVVSESGEVASESSQWQSTTPLSEGDYTAEVRVAQTVSGALFWSALDTQAFSVDVDSPATPTITLVPESSEGRIRIDLDDPGGGAVSTDFFVVETSPDNATWTALPTNTAGLIVPVSGAASVYDYDAPNGSAVYYRAHAVHWFTGTGGVVTSSASAWAKDSDLWSSGEWWLKHPTRPSLNLNPVLKSQPSIASSIGQGVFSPLGRRTAVVVSDVRRSWTGEVVLRCDSDAEREALDAILADGQPLLLQGPADAYWDERWLAVSSQERTRAIDQSWNPITFDALVFTETERPDSDLEE
jgi:hypothetical protein